MINFTAIIQLIFSPF